MTYTWASHNVQALVQHRTQSTHQENHDGHGGDVAHVFEHFATRTTHGHNPKHEHDCPQNQPHKCKSRSVAPVNDRDALDVVAVPTHTKRAKIKIGVCDLVLRSLTGIPVFHVLYMSEEFKACNVSETELGDGSACLDCDAQHQQRSHTYRDAI